MENAAKEVQAVEAAHNQFVTVPGRTLGNGAKVASFMVGKYLSALEDCKVVVTESAVPTVRIDYESARQACAESGLALLTLSQSAALALDVAEQAANWSSGVVGEGMLLQGLHRGTVRGAVAGNYVSPKENERRGFVLSNGEVVFDVAGHLYTWLFDDVHGDAAGLIATRSFPADSPVVCGAPAPAGEKGVGWYPKAARNWSGNALVRGGCWCSDDYAGVFDLGDDWPDNAYDYVGFRCTKPVGV